MTRDERILSLETVVLRGARLAARQYNRRPEDVVDLAWITAITVADNHPELSGADLAQVTYTAIRRRAIDLQRAEYPTIRNRSRHHYPAVKLMSIDGVHDLPDVRPRRLQQAAEARISVDWIRKRLKPAPNGSPSAFERNWAMTYARLAGELDLPLVAAAYGLSCQQASGGIQFMLRKLRRLATGSP